MHEYKIPGHEHRYQTKERRKDQAEVVELHVVPYFRLVD